MRERERVREKYNVTSGEREDQDERERTSERNNEWRGRTSERENE